MREVVTLIKKEIIEHNRNFKNFAALIIFLIIGIMSPLLALVTPDLLEKTLSESLGDVTIPDPTAADSFLQFLSNVNQIGLIVFFIVFGGILTNEIKSGTIINLLTKGVKRSKVVVSKILYLTILWTIFYTLSAVVTYLYTVYYFDELPDDAVVGLVVNYVFGLFLISLLIILSVIFRSATPTLLSMASILVVLYLIQLFSGTELLPVSLINSAEMMMESEVVDSLNGAMTVTFVLTVLNLILSIVIFNKREII